MSDRKPNLPDPGDNCYWSIRMDSDGDFTLTLREKNGEPIAESDYIYANAASADRFEAEAVRMLNSYNKKTQFVGDYKFGDNS